MLGSLLLALTEYEITAEDIKQIQAALPIIRAMALAESLLQKIVKIPDLLGTVRRLELQKAGLESSLAADRAASVRKLEAMLQQTQQAADAEAARKQEAAEGKIRAVETTLKSLQKDEAGMRAGLLQTKARFESELETLRETIRKASENSARELDLARTEAKALQASLGKEREGFANEKRALEQDIAALKEQKKRMADQLRAALG